MKIYLVGGAVRDKLLGLPIKERDYVVVGASIEDMLNRGFRQVGKEFPVFLHPKTGEEYALARMERKVKLGYKGFTFDSSPLVSLEDDLKRRDLTINAMAYDEESATLIDPHHGQQDIHAKLLRHVSLAFSEDPVRILRVGRFLSRLAYLGFTVDSETNLLMQKMVQAGEINALVPERVWKEFERALAEKNPEKFFDVLDACGAMPILFPHLDKHGPGIKALIAAAKLTPDPLVRFAALLYAYPEKTHDQKEVKKAIAHFCHQYRVPNAYHALATLTALHNGEALAAKSKSPKSLLHLLSVLDVFRREVRFHDFLMATTAIAHSQGKTFDSTWLADCAKAAKAVDVKQLVEEGFSGQALAKKIQTLREQKIADWLTTSA